MAITKLKINNKTYDIGGGNPDIATYQGRELSEYSWADLKTMCNSGDFSNIRVGDYKTIISSDPTYEDFNGHKMQIAGIDTYYNINTDYGVIPHHIDLISVDTFRIYGGSDTEWTTNNNNNGQADNGNSGVDSNIDLQCPYMNSNIKARLDLFSGKLPLEIRNVITDKINLLELRPHPPKEDIALTDSIDQIWENMGQLWLPTEYEVLGSTIGGTKKWSSGVAVQYPLFANNAKFRRKLYRIYQNDVDGYVSGKSEWWLATVGSNSETEICSIDRNGCLNNYPLEVGNSADFPLCFRIAGNN